MSITQEFSSWFAPPQIPISQPPEIGSNAPSSPQLSFPPTNGKPTIISFLRHCGCPVAEATLLTLRTSAATHNNVNFIAISHSDSPSTQTWLDSIGGPGSVTVLVDNERALYAKWGLGTVSWSHVLSPAGLDGIWRLGKEEGIWNRPTESGSRWQGAGNWAVDEGGVVRWGGPVKRVDEVVDVEAALGALG
ncbi:hypothetical protein N7532_010088, partial [Penicillium argentinense]